MAIGLTMPAVLVNLVLLAVIVVVFRRYRGLKRERFIREEPLPAGLLEKLAKRRPER